MAIILIERNDIAAKDLPEGVDQKPSNSGSVEKCADIRVAVRIAPNTGTEPLRFAVSI
jgi:hypothetical protein